MRHYTLLNTNEPPEESDLPSFHSAVSDADTHLARIQEKLEALKEKMALLEGERAVLSSYRMSCRAVLSPLRKMPPEILGEIFSLTLPSVSDALNSSGINMGLSP
jgi:hypothetical protein